MDAGGKYNGVYAGFVVLTFDVEYDEDDGSSSSKLVFSFDEMTDGGGWV